MVKNEASYGIKSWLAVFSLYIDMKKIQCGKNIWPDVEGPNDVNRFLEKYGIKLSFLLYDGIEFELPDNIEVYEISKGSCFFRDTKTKNILLHYYETFGELVFEDVTGEKFMIPILEEDPEIIFLEEDPEII